MTTQAMVLTARPHGGAFFAAVHRIYDAITTVGAVAVAMVGALALVLSVSTHLSHQQEYTVFGHPVLTVLSGSMTPAIRTGDLIIDSPVHSTAAAHLQVGQIITFRDPNAASKLITHRIYALAPVAGGQAAYVTKGDANNAPDATPVPAGNAIGVFDHKVSRGGYFLAALHRPMVLALLVASPILWFVSGSLIAYGRRPDDDVEVEP